MNITKINTAVVTALFTAVSITPSVGFAAFRCYESRSMCEDIEDLGTRTIKEFAQPIFLDVETDDLEDTWGAARGNGGSHQGTDIFADRGALIVMPTDGVVDRTGVSGLGGKHVFIYIGGGEKLYFAHLDDWADGLSDGDVLRKGDLVGYVGNTGAEYTVPHLHLTVYKDGVADNPYPRMEDEEWTLKEKMLALDKVIDADRDSEELAAELYKDYRSLFDQAEDKDIRLPGEIDDLIDGKKDAAREAEEELQEQIEQELKDIIKEVEEMEEEKEEILEDVSDYDLFETDLSVNSDNEDEIKRLQRFLNDTVDADIRVNGQFDDDTLQAAKDFQNKYSKQVLDIWGLDTATGYVGITTRLRMNYMIQAGNTNQCPVFDQYNSRTQNTSSNEVKKTEQLLKELGFFSGTPDTEWNSETHASMIAFQERFGATMLEPWGLTRGTGYKYKTTNKFMNYLRGCDTGEVQLEGRGTFDF